MEALGRLVVWWKEGQTGLLAARSAYDGDFAVDISPTVQSKIHINVQGTKNQTIQVTQQLAWLSSVFKLGCDGLAHSKLHFETVSPSPSPDVYASC